MKAAEYLDWYFNDEENHNASDGSAHRHDKPISATHAEAHLLNLIRTVLLVVFE